MCGEKLCSRTCQVKTRVDSQKQAKTKGYCHYQNHIKMDEKSFLFVEGNLVFLPSYVDINCLFYLFS